MVGSVFWTESREEEIYRSIIIRPTTPSKPVFGMDYFDIEVGKEGEDITLLLNSWFDAGRFEGFQYYRVMECVFKDGRFVRGKRTPYHEEWIKGLDVEEGSEEHRSARDDRPIQNSQELKEVLVNIVGREAYEQARKLFLDSSLPDGYRDGLRELLN